MKLANARQRASLRLKNPPWPSLKPGNQRTEKTPAGALTTYAWDHRNRLTKVEEKSAAGTVTKRTTYVYDVFDRRLGKTIDPDGDSGSAALVTTRYVYDFSKGASGESDIVLAFNGSGSVTNRYLHGPTVDQILADEQIGGNLLWPLADNLGTVRDLVDNTGTVVNHIKYDSFGRVTSETNAAIDHLYGFTGRERDEETGLMYYRARYFDAAVGRFLSEDPIGFAAGDANLSRYVGNNAANVRDPSGQQPPPGMTGDSYVEAYGEIFVHMLRCECLAEDFDLLMSLSPEALSLMQGVGDEDMWAEFFFLYGITGVDLLNQAAAWGWVIAFEELWWHDHWIDGAGRRIVRGQRIHATLERFAHSARGTGQAALRGTAGQTR